MAKGKFTSIAIDQLINQITSDVDQLANDIDNYDSDNIAPNVTPEINNLVDANTQGMTVDFKRVYNQLEKLIENGNAALETLAAIDIDVLSTETVTASTSLINAIKNCISEFTKIHLNHVKFMQNLQLEETRQRNKIALLEKKNELYAKRNGTLNNSVDTQLIEIGDNDLAEFLQNKLMQEDAIKKLN